MPFATLFVMGLITWAIGGALEARDRKDRERRVQEGIAEFRALRAERDRKQDEARALEVAERARREDERAREIAERQRVEQERRDHRRRAAVRMRDEQYRRLGVASSIDALDDGGDVVLYFVANHADRTPWIVWRFWPETGRIEVCDAPTRTWAATGWPARYLTGADTNCSDLHPRDLERILISLARP